VAKINSINNKSQELTIDPGASGDSFVQFDINTTGKFRMGVDDDASDSFKISSGSALGTTDAFVMSANGERTMPLQSAFSAYNSTDRDDAMGDAYQYSYIYDTEIFDQNSDYNTSTGVFTAPIAGRYCFVSSFKIHDLTAAHTRDYSYLAAAKSYYVLSANLTAFDIGGAIGLSNMQFVDMDAADTAYLTMTVNGSGGTKVVDVNGGGNMVTRFSGFLAV